MLYAILCYHDEDVVYSWSQEEDAAVMARLGAVQERLIKDGKMGPSLRLQPSPVVTLNRAVAVGKLHGPAAALEMIEPLAPRLSGYFHFFGAKGAFLLQLGRTNEARAAFDQAIALAHTPAEAVHIRRYLDRLTAESAPASRLVPNPSCRWRRCSGAPATGSSAIPSVSSGR